MNFSGSGLSWTLGPQRASVRVGRRGGTFLRLSGGREHEAARTVTYRATVSVSDDGTVTLTDSQGAPLSDYLVSAAKKHHGDTIRDLVTQKVEDLNASVEALGEVDLSTPPPLAPRFAKEPFDHTRPSEPSPRPIGFWSRLLRSRRARIEAENAAARAEYERRVAAWEKARALHQLLQEQRRKLHEEDVRHGLEAMARVLEESAQNLAWPRETSISLDVAPAGRSVALDVDLPEIEDMPTKVAAVAGRGFEIKFNEASRTKVRQLYMRHVHGVGFRLVGEVFARLPVREEVTLSAFSQRPDKQTGQIEDQYLYSVRVSRAKWREIDFANLDDVDVVAALERFELWRKMSKTGSFQVIEPFPGPTAEAP